MNTPSSQPELNLTPVERQPLPPPDKPPFNPVRLLVDTTLAARLWCGLFLVALGLHLAEHLISPPSHTGQVVVVDASGAPHMGKAEPLAKALPLHIRQATLATQALLNTSRNFDSPELLESLYSPAALAKAKAQFDQDSPEREAKHLHQKVEIKKIDVLQTRGDPVLVDIIGQLIRTGTFGEQPFFEGVPFRLRLTMVLNPDLELVATFPTQVADFQLQL